MTDKTVSFESASKLLEHLGIVSQIPVDVNDIASKLGIDIENYLFPSSELVGEILFQDDRPIIRINPARNQYEPRRRFTIAHEIGHYCLHSAKSKKGFKDSKKAMSRTESYWDIEESEANSFAANLLMPASLIYDAGKKVIQTYKDLTNATKIPVGVFTETMADKFVVSNKAMEYRLRNLRIIRN